MRFGNPFFKRAPAIVAFVAAIGFCESAFALQDVLTFRLNTTSGHWEAAIDGVTFNCELHEEARFYSPYSITSSGNNFTVLSPYEINVCQGGPEVNYEVVADLGVLAPGSYNLTWTVLNPDVPQDPLRSLSGSFVAEAAALAIVPAPVLDGRTTSLLAGALLALGWLALLPSRLREISDRRRDQRF